MPVIGDPREVANGIRSENWFLSLEDARDKVESWRKHYNGGRPHGALGNLALLESAAADGPENP